MGLCLLFALGACGAEDPGRRPRAGNGGSVSPGTGGAGEGGSGTGGDSGEGGDSGQGGSGSGGDSGQGGTGGGNDRVFDAGDAALNTGAVGTICDRLTTIQCAGEQFCCSDPQRSFDDCKAVFMDGCEDELMFDAIAGDARSGFDMAHAAAVLNEIQTRAAACDIDIASFGESLAGLRGMFKGTVAAGGSCTSLNPLNREDAAKALSSCADPANNACLPELALWTCMPRQPEGGDCFSDVNCVDGLFCPNPNFDISGSTCAPRKADGVACQLPNECVSLYCKNGMCVAPGVDAAYCLRANL